MDKEKNSNENIENEVQEVITEEENEEVEDQETEECVSNEEEKYKEIEEKYLRLLAEYDNYQKRTIKEKQMRYTDALVDTVNAFLPVLDDLSRALDVETLTQEAQNFKSGVELVKKKMDDALKKLEVEPIEALGNEFDPNIHNAILHVEDETAGENIVVEEFMKGYIYKNDRVVRHSMVKVAN